MESFRHTCGQWVHQLALKMVRRKVIRQNPMETELKRVLTTLGIALFGVGQMAGGGPFVVAGAVAQMAGPAMVFSFLIAGLTAILSGLCFAEFASAIPRAGSGYLFTYVTMGEFMAFLVGWQMILDQIVNVASVSSAVSGAINALSDRAIENFTISHVGTFANQPLLAPYPDFVGFGLGLLAACAMCFGLSRSAFLSNFLNTINLLVIAFCLCFGFATANAINWTYKGFAPFGFAGVMRGAASSFTSYIGFEGIATAGEETVNPRRTIPIVLLSVLLTLVVLYVLMGAALTLAVPFEYVDVQAAFPQAFSYHGHHVAKHVASAGISLGMFGALIGSLYAVSRTAYAMASDGMLFSFFGKVNQRTSGPLIGEVIFGVLAAFLALIFDLEILVELQCVGTLMTYTVICGCSIVLHYQRRVRIYGDDTPGIEIFRVADRKEDEAPKEVAGENSDFIRIFKEFFPRFAVDIALLCFAIFIGLAYALSIDLEEDLEKRTDTRQWWAIIPGLIMLAGAFVAYVVIASHQERDLHLLFRIPSVPLIPALAMALNILLIVYISKLTWFRFGVWIALGLVIYFAYAIWHSRILIDEQTTGTHAPGPLGPGANSPSRELERKVSLEVEVDERTPLLIP